MNNEKNEHAGREFKTLDGEVTTFASVLNALKSLNGVSGALVRYPDLVRGKFTDKEILEIFVVAGDRRLPSPECVEREGVSWGVLRDELVGMEFLCGVYIEHLMGRSEFNFYEPIFSFHTHFSSEPGQMGDLQRDAELRGIIESISNDYPGTTDYNVTGNGTVELFDATGRMLEVISAGEMDRYWRQA